MKEFMKNRAISTKNFVIRHKEGLIVGGIALVVITAQKNNLVEMNKFIAEHGLLEEFVTSQV